MQFWRLTTVSQEAGTPLQGSYDPYLVILSVFVASLAGFVALSVSDRIITSKTRLKRWSWLSLGSVAMGAGVWAMHFSGMMAYSLPITVKYNLLITMVSAVPAIIGSGAALYTMADSSINWKRLQVGAFFMAACIGTMHYTGMEAMRMPAILRYDFFMFLMSLLVAYLLSSVALYIKFIIDPMLSRSRIEVLGIASLIIGLAVSGLHYTALEATLIYPDETSTGVAGAYISSTSLMVSILLTATFIMIAAIVATIVNVKFNVAFRARQRTQQQLNLALDAARAGVWQWNPDTNEEVWDDNFRDLMGIDEGTEPSHENFIRQVIPEDRERVRSEISAALEDSDSYKIEFRTNTDGRTRWIQAIGRVHSGPGERTRMAQGIVLDVTERKQAELDLKEQQVELEKSLEERTTLLREVHHRVKNNLQMIISLLDLQERDSSGSYSGESSLRNIKNRVHSMALIHEHVYEQASIADLDAEQYLSTLIDHIVDGQVPPSLELTVNKHIEPCELHLDTLLPCGIVTNELLTNALQHGFEGRDEGTIDFEFRRIDDSRFELLVSDDGVGMPPNVSFDDSPSLGLNLVRRLVQNQLNGSIEQLESEGGLSLRLVVADVRNSRHSLSHYDESLEGDASAD